MHDIVIAELQALLDVTQVAVKEGLLSKDLENGVEAALRVVSRLVVQQPTRERLLQRIKELRERHRGDIDLREELRVLTLPKPPCPPFDWGDRRLTSLDIGKRITVYWINPLDNTQWYPHRVSICDVRDDGSVYVSDGGVVAHGPYTLYEILDPQSLEE